MEIKLLLAGINNQQITIIEILKRILTNRDKTIPRGRCMNRFIICNNQKYDEVFIHPVFDRGG